MTPIAVQGRNCWRVAHARRAAFIIDGENYYRALREAMCRARRSIFIIGWDVHSQVRLVCNHKEDNYPETLGALINALVKEHRGLHVYILNWDFAMIYTMDREFFPAYKLSWRSSQRVHFCLDGEHPVGGSQHQKVVVIDDRIAFCGGIDLSKSRWDTSAHRIEDECRIDPDGRHYRPFHDLQTVVDGRAAEALGELARERWRFGGGIDPVGNDSGVAHDPWPPSIPPVLSDIDVGIARTLPAYKERREVREVERLYLDSIAAARKFIYIEAQHFSSNNIAQALLERLAEPQGPEVVMIMPDRTDDWLEQHTMDVLRARLVKELRQADRHDRLRLYYVRLSREPHVSLMVHAKLMIIDDRFVHHGSSNLTNRSLGLDSECDLVIESTPSQDCGEAIAGLRRRLLAEHLNREVQAVAEAEAAQASLIAAIESLRGGEHCLEPLYVDIPESFDEWVPDSALLDPEKPIEPNEMFDYFVDPEQQKPLYRRFLRISLLLLVVFGLVAMWRWTPLSDYLDIDIVAAAGEWIDARPFTPLLILAAYLIAGLAAVPITLMIIATVMVFGPWAGVGYALVGSQLSALAAFGIGHLLGRDSVRKLAGSRVNRLSRALGKRGMLTIITLRIVPVAPFIVINVIAGVSEIRLRDFAIGSTLGMVPGVVAMALLADRMVASLRDPSLTSIAVLIAVVALVVLCLLGLRKLIAHKRVAYHP
jgi:phospholipase D1/2